jgi:hypothetical protein
VLVLIHPLIELCGSAERSAGGHASILLLNLSLELLTTAILVCLDRVCEPSMEINNMNICMHGCEVVTALLYCTVHTTAPCCVCDRKKLARRRDSVACRHLLETGTGSSSGGRKQGNTVLLPYDFFFYLYFTGRLIKK